MNEWSVFMMPVIFSGALALLALVVFSLLAKVVVTITSWLLG